MNGTCAGRQCPTDENELPPQEPDGMSRPGPSDHLQLSGYELVLLAFTISVVVFAFGAEYRSFTAPALIVSIGSLLTAASVSVLEVAR